MRWEPVCTNLMKIFITHNCARASWPSSPHLATFLPSFGHVWETIFSSGFLTKLFYHISFGCFHSTCSQDQWFSMENDVVYGWIGAIKQSLGLVWVGLGLLMHFADQWRQWWTNQKHALLSTNGKPELSAPADRWNKNQTIAWQVHNCPFILAGGGFSWN